MSAPPVGIGGPLALLALVCAVAAVPASAQVFELARDGELKRVETVTAPPPPARPDRQDAIEALLTEAAEANDLSPALLKAVARGESSLDPAAVSPRGALGVMQLMPATARDLHIDARDPAANIFGGAAYLRALLDRFDGRIDLALAGYNAGPGAVTRRGGVPPYRETRTYVARNLDRLAAESLAPTAKPRVQPRVRPRVRPRIQP